MCNHTDFIHQTLFAGLREYYCTMHFLKLFVAGGSVDYKFETQQKSEVSLPNLISLFFISSSQLEATCATTSITHLHLIFWQGWIMYEIENTKSLVWLHWFWSFFRTCPLWVQSAYRSTVLDKTSNLSVRMGRVKLWHIFLSFLTLFRQI